MRARRRAFKNLCPSVKAVAIQWVAKTYPTKRGTCSECGYVGPVNDGGNLWRHGRALMAGIAGVGTEAAQ